MASDSSAPATPARVTQPHRGVHAAAMISSATGMGPAPPTLRSLLGAAGLVAAGSSHEMSKGSSAIAGDSTALASAPPAFALVLSAVSKLQSRLRESESTVQDLQAGLDEVEERRRSWARRAERLERERDLARRQRNDKEEEVKVVRLEASPLVEKYMEAEVLRSQMQAMEAHLERLKQELMDTREELDHGWPRLTDAEDAEAQCTAALGVLEASHSEEVAVLRSLHHEEIADARARHASRMGEIEAARQEEVAMLKVGNAEELSNLKSALENAQWQADVHVREQQDAVRETCLRQRENARLAKRFGESRQEVLELAVKLEAIRAATAGAPAREAELHAINQRSMLLQRTAAEWREALERKQLDCEVWRRRAAQRGVADDPDDRIEDDLQASQLAASLASSHAVKVQSGHAHPPRLDEVAALDVSNPSTPGRLTPVQPASPSAPSCEAASGDASSKAFQGALHLGPPGVSRVADQPTTASSCSSVPTPSRTSQRARQHGGSSHGQYLKPSQKQHRPRHEFPRQQYQPPQRTAPTPTPPLRLPFSSPWPSQLSDRHDVSGGFMQLALPASQPADEYLAVAVRAARLQARAEAAGSRAGGHSARSTGSHLSEDVPSGRLDVALEEAENELVMQACLMDESDVLEAEHLLEMEAQRQPPPVAARLRAHLAELAPRISGRGGSRTLSNPSSPERNFLMVR